MNREIEEQLSNSLRKAKNERDEIFADFAKNVLLDPELCESYSQAEEKIKKAEEAINKYSKNMSSYF